MNTLNCLLLDDEPLAIEVLESHLSSYHQIKITGKFFNPLKALEFIQSNPLDLIFLDIDMPHINGIQLLEHIKKNTLVVFTTAHDEFAIKAFEKDVLDYLVKPISLLRFIRTMDKVFERFQNIQPQGKPEKEYFYFKSNKKWVRIQLESILFIESIKDYLKVVTAEKKIIIHKTLSSLVDELPNDSFMRIHRSFCIALNKIDATEGNTVLIKNFKIPIGRKYLKEFKERIIKPREI